MKLLYHFRWENLLNTLTSSRNSRYVQSPSIPYSTGVFHLERYLERISDQNRLVRTCGEISGRPARLRGLRHDGSVGHLLSPPSSRSWKALDLIVIWFDGCKLLGRNVRQRLGTRTRRSANLSFLPSLFRNELETAPESRLIGTLVSDLTIQFIESYFPDDGWHAFAVRQPLVHCPEILRERNTRTQRGTGGGRGREGSKIKWTVGDRKRAGGREQRQEENTVDKALRPLDSRVTIERSFVSFLC